MKNNIIEQEEIFEKLSIVDNCDYDEIKKAKDKLRVILEEEKMPPLIFDFDWINGESSMSDDLSIEYNIQYLKENHSYKIEIKDIKNNKIIKNKQFKSYIKAKEYGDKYQVKEVKKLKIN